MIIPNCKNVPPSVKRLSSPLNSLESVQGHQYPIQSRRVVLTLGTLLTLFAFGYVCQPQSVWADKPEVMLVVDASSSMERLQRGLGYPVGCDWPRQGADPQGVANAGPQGFGLQGGEQRDFDNLTRLHWAQWHLVGPVEGRLGCVGHDSNERETQHKMGRDGFIAHYRLMCSAERGGLGPCGADHGRSRLSPDPEGANGESALPNAGFIYEARSDVLFGLMVSDSDPQNVTEGGGANRSDWSYGESTLLKLPPSTNGAGARVKQNILALYSQADTFGASVFTSAARNPRSAWVDNANDDLNFYLSGLNGRRINLGVRGADAPQGRMISPYKGVARDERVDVNPNDNASVISHNDLIRHELRSIVPHGPSPLSAMLKDLYEHYASEPARCEPRLAILVTDGAESTYLPTRSCNNDQQCRGNGLMGMCAFAPQTSRISHERYENIQCVENANANAQGQGNQGQGQGNQGQGNQGQGNQGQGNQGQGNQGQGNQGQGVACTRVCTYPEGAPYESAIEIARQLHDELNVSVIIALVGHSPLADVNYDLDQLSPSAAYAYHIAAVGSPELGPQEGVPGIYNLESLPHARDLIARMKIIGGAKVRSETQPQVLAVSLGDAYVGQEPDLNLRQLRASVYGYTPLQDTRRYSKLEAVKMGCGGVQMNAQGLKVMGDVDYGAKLVQQRQRPVFTYAPNNDDARSVVDAASPLFNEDGTKRGNDYKAFIGNASTNMIKQIALQMRGFFGARGLDQGEPNLRGYGGIARGDLVALAPTGSGRNGMGDDQFYELNRERPHLLFFGGDDGLIHAVRAFDGFNLFSFAPQTTWSKITRDQEVNIDGPLVAGEVIPCRGEGGGCGAGNNARVRSMVIGGVGEVGREIFGFEVSGFTPNELRERQPNLDTWPRDAVMWSLTPTHEPDLGLAVSRPILAHVKIEGQVKGVVIVGCGDDPTSNNRYRPDFSGVGRCLLIIEAESGEVLHKVTGDQDQNGLLFPVVGSPTAYPAQGAAAEQVYFGDLIGQVFRLDLSGDQRDQWKLNRIWPLEDPRGEQIQLQRGLGHAVLERPSLALDSNNDRIVIFATGEPKIANLAGYDLADQGYMVSLRERRFFDDNNRVEVETTANWVLEFATGEYATGAPRVRDNTAFITSSRPAQAVGCGGQQQVRQGRLYGVHYTKALDEPYLDAFGNRSLRVVPMIPRYNQRGERVENALALVLPPGRTAHGFSLIPTPSCALGAASLTELVLNLTDETGGDDVLLNGLSVEYVQGGVGEQAPGAGAGADPGAGAGAKSLARAELQEDLEVKVAKNLLMISFAPGQGEAQGTLYSPVAPFPSRMLYWGSGGQQ